MTTTTRDDRRIPTKTKVEHPTVGRAGGAAARPCAPTCPARAHADLDPGPGRARTRSPSSRARPRPACPSLCRSATGACSSRPSRSTAAPRSSWPATSRADADERDCASQLCGDAHLSNFGVFGTPERRLDFDVNDFDETLPGPCEWDVKRLAASLAVAGREQGLRRRRARGRGPGLREQLPRPPWPTSPGRATSRSSTRGSTSTTLVARYQATVATQGGQARREGAGQGAHQGQHAGPRRS